MDVLLQSRRCKFALFFGGLGQCAKLKSPHGPRRSLQRVAGRMLSLGIDCCCQSKFLKAA